MHHDIRLLMELRGSMTRFDTITPEAVLKSSGGRITYDQLADWLHSFGLSIDHVVYDETRFFCNTFYADYQKGLYNPIMLSTGHLMEDDISSRVLAEQTNGNYDLLSKNWRGFYALGVPVPMMIYDFQRRVHDIDPAQVFKVWLNIWDRIDFSFNMWNSEVIEYVFSLAPACELPAADADGMVEIYRGMGDLSQPAESAHSWTTDIRRAMWFATHTGHGTKFATGKIPLKDIVYYHRTAGENEILVRPGSVRDIQHADMIPVRKEPYMELTQFVFPIFLRYGAQTATFDLKHGGIMPHGDNTDEHAWHVLYLALIYHEHSGCGLTMADRNIMIYFSLLHDIACIDNDEEHGAVALEMIRKNGYRVSDLRMTKKDYRIAALIIEYHCRKDEDGNAAIDREPGFTRKDKDRARLLYAICKDLDELTQERAVMLDYRKLRTQYAQKLPFIAGALENEELGRYFRKEHPLWENNGN